MFHQNQTDLFGQSFEKNESKEIKSSLKDIKFKKICRNQKVFNAFFIDNLIPKYHEARAIMEFLDEINLSSFIKSYKTLNGKSGRTAIHPKILIGVWLYAISKGISSAREIARLIEYNPAFQWITGMELICYHTLSTFRSSNKKAIDDLFINTLSILTKEGLVTLERIMHDGTKIKAYASADNFKREGTLESHIKLVKEQIELMGDPEDDGISLKAKKAQERVLNEKLKKLELAKKELKKIKTKKKKK